MRRWAPMVLLAALLAAGCGADEGEDASNDPGTASKAPDYAPALESAPPALAKLYENGSERIEGGEEAYDATLEGLRGYPVVVNQWGSWCGPCRVEFPFFQAQAAERLDEVAFLGVDTQDSPEAYATFIEDNPVPYPSVADDEGALAEWIGKPLVGLPNTLFYDAEGELVYTRFGPYESEEDLAADIDRYASGPSATQ